MPASDTEPDNYSIDDMMDRLRSRSEGGQEDAQLVTREDGTQVYRVKKRKRRSHQPKKEKEQRHLLLHAQSPHVVLPEAELTWFTLAKSVFEQEYEFERDHNMAYLDAEKLIYPLILRSRQAGDRFKPMGMNNFKKLSDLFIDEKVPVTKKDDIPILVNGNGEIIWVIGFRQDNRYRISPATKNVTILTYRNLHITISKQS